MRGYLLLAAAGAAAISIPVSASPGAAQPANAARAWWFAGELRAAPDRRLFYIDRNSIARRGDQASARAMMVFEQPQDGIRAFETTYEFRCGTRQQRTRNALYTMANGGVEPGSGPPDPWEPTAQGSATEAVFNAACGGRFAGEARSIAGLPLAEAQRLFAANAAPGAPSVSKPSSGGLMSREALVQCLNGSTPPDTPACRNARASAERGRAARTPQAPARAVAAASAGQESYAQLLDSIVQEDSKAWHFNKYEPGSMMIVDVRRDAQGNISMLRGNYRYDMNRRITGTLLDVFTQIPPGAPAGAPTGWVEAYFADGRLQCLQYHDRSECLTSTRDYYQRGNQQGSNPEAEHHEYCVITRNC